MIPNFKYKSYQIRHLYPLFKKAGEAREAGEYGEKNLVILNGVIKGDLVSTYQLFNFIIARTLVTINSWQDRFILT